MCCRGNRDGDGVPTKPMEERVMACKGSRRPVLEYRLLACNRAAELESAVNKLLQVRPVDGSRWELRGKLFVFNGGYRQAMVRR